MVNKAGQSLTEIVESIKKVTAVVGEIANASAEQSTGLEEISKALTQMDEVTQQNSALVEENAATAKTLEQQAKAMATDKRIAFFQPRGTARAEGALQGDSDEGSDVATHRSGSPRSSASSKRPAAA